MSYTKTLHVPITFRHQIEESRHELTAADYLAALKVHVAAVERDPQAAFAKAIYEATMEVEEEDAWVMRSANHALMIKRGPAGVTLTSAKDIRETDVLTSFEAAAQVMAGPIDPTGLFVPIEYLDLDLAVAEIHNGAGDLVGLVDLRPWFNRGSEGDLRKFLEEPGSGEVLGLVLADAQEAGSPNVAYALTQTELTMTVRDMAAAREILYDLRLIFVDEDPQP